jgi:predicted transcriptional regulator
MVEYGDDYIEYFIAALENETRREILRRLISDRSYALEISRNIGVSQQAINKHLAILEEAKLIISQGLLPSNSGAARKMYRPTGFSTLVVDYSRNFFDIRRYPLEFDMESEDIKAQESVKSMVNRLREVDKSIGRIMAERESMLKEKDSLIYALKSVINRSSTDSTTRRILETYIETLDSDATAAKLSLPVEIVNFIVDRFLEVSGH